MNFDVGDKSKLGTLNDVYRKSNSRGKFVLPDRKFNVEKSNQLFAKEIQMLAALPHYFGYGLVICNPLLWHRFASANDVAFVNNAKDAYDMLKADLRIRLQYDDGSSQFKKKWDPTSKKYVPAPLDSLLDESPGSDEYIVVPKFLAFSMFGPSCVDVYYPHWIKPQIAKQMLDAPDEATMRDLLVRISTTSRPPAQVNLRQAFAKILQQSISMTIPLSLNIVLRSTPLEQMAIVAFCIYQLRKAMEGFVTGVQTHQASGIICLPCGGGKTKIAGTIWHDFFCPEYDSLESNDFGLIAHNIEPKKTEEPPKNCIQNFFVSTSKPKTLSSAPPVVGNNAFYDWLRLNPNAHNRSAVPPTRTGKLLWIADHDDLLEQAATALQESMPGARIALLKQKKRPDPRKCDIVIASIKTVLKQTFQAGYFENFMMVIFDEAHRNMSKSFRKIMEKVGCIPFALFLTATPRHDGLRMIGGPIFVSATRPFVEQEHVVVLMSGVDCASRPARIMEARYKRKSGAKQGAAGTPDTSAMIQDLTINHTRNMLIVDTLYSICNNASSLDDYRVYQVTRMPQPSTNLSQSWASFNDVAYRSPQTIYNCKGLRTTMDFAWQESPSIKVHHDPTKSPRVPIVFSNSVQHILMLQHMYAQKWMVSAKATDQYKDSNLQIVRTGLRQLAVVNLDTMTCDQKRRLKWISGQETPAFSCSSLPEAEVGMKKEGEFDAPFWQQWFKKYPLCKRIAVESGSKYPFQTDEDEKKNKAKKSTPLAGASGAKPVKKADKPEGPETKKFTSSHWMYKSQYYWTPVYYPLPSAVFQDEMQDGEVKKLKTVRKKRKRSSLNDEPEEEEDEQDTKLFRRQVLNDTRPLLDSTQVLATFGLYIGIGTYPSPSSLLSDIALKLKTPHNLEALNSNYVFANYAIASTGIDREQIDTTVMAVPYVDVEQLHGRALRIADKQRVLHLEFAEPMGSFPQQTNKHMLGMAQQDIVSQVFVVSPNAQKIIK